MEAAPRNIVRRPKAEVSFSRPRRSTSTMLSLVEDEVEDEDEDEDEVEDEEKDEIFWHLVREM